MMERSCLMAGQPTPTPPPKKKKGWGSKPNAFRGYVPGSKNGRKSALCLKMTLGVGLKIPPCHLGDLKL